MKIKFILIFYLITVFKYSYGQIKFTIKGEIINSVSVSTPLKEKDTVILKFLDKSIVPMVAIINDSKFSFNSTLLAPSVAMIEYKTGGTKVLLDNNNYDFALEAVHVGGNRYAFKSSIRTSSVFHTLWEKFYKDQKLMMDKKQKLLNLRQSAFKDSLDVIDLELNFINESIKNSYGIIALGNSDNFAIPYILIDAPDFSYEKYMDVFNKLTDSVKNSYYGRILNDKLAMVKNISLVTKSTDTTEKLIGTKLNSFNAVDTNGIAIKIDRKLLTAKFTLIDFWASWCAPCRTANIDLRSKMIGVDNKKLKVVGFSLDANSNDWKKAVKEENSGWMQLSDLMATHSPIVNHLKISNIPFNIIVDENGTIVAKNIFYKDLENFISEL